MRPFDFHYALTLPVAIVTALCLCLDFFPTAAALPIASTERLELQTLDRRLRKCFGGCGGGGGSVRGSSHSPPRPMTNAGAEHGFQHPRPSTEAYMTGSQNRPSPDHSPEHVYTRPSTEAFMTGSGTRPSPYQSPERSHSPVRTSIEEPAGHSNGPPSPSGSTTSTSRHGSSPARSSTSEPVMGMDYPVYPPPFARELPKPPLLLDLPVGNRDRP